jgi:SAM-dependent methyltransferase
MATSSYDAIPDFGLLYDSVPLYGARKDIGFYVQEAAGARAPVLELGCGTGRILLPIARTGCSVVGLDNSPQMLARCREKLGAESAPVRSRVTLHQQDVHEFDLGVTFPLVIAPFRIVQHLTTTEDQLQFLSCVLRHLAPGGRFIFDVFNPSFTALVGADGTEREDTPEQPLPDGRSFRRTARVKRVRWLDQVSEIELTYYVSGQAFVQAFNMRWYLHAELVHLLARAGFRITEVFGDFARAPLVDDSLEQVVRAERA